VGWINIRTLMLFPWLLTRLIYLMTKKAFMLKEESTNNGTQWESRRRTVTKLGKRGFLWERPAEIFYFEKGNLALQQMLGIRIRGNYTRKLQFKSFNVFARKFYDGQSGLLTPLFDEISFQKSFIYVLVIIKKDFCKLGC